MQKIKRLSLWTTAPSWSANQLECTNTAWRDHVMQELIWRLHHLSQPFLQEETSNCSQNHHLHFFPPPVSGSTIIWHPRLPGSDIVTVLVCSAGVVVWQEGKQECSFSAQGQGYFTGIVAVSFADTIWPKLQMNSISSPTDPPKSELQSLSWTMQKNTGADNLSLNFPVFTEEAQHRHGAQ